MRLQRIGVTALVCAVLTLSSCGSGSHGGGGGVAGTFTLLVAADGGQNYDPQKNAAPSSGQFLMPVFDTLLGDDASGNKVPGLATKWQFSKDGKTLTLTLRKGVTFHDGSDFNADAVKANLERGAKDPDSVIAGQLASISAVTVVDDTTLTLTLKAPDGALLGFFTGPAGMMASPKSWQNPNVKTHPVGTGPWQVDAASAPGSEMVYTAYKNYWDPKVQTVQTVRIRNGAESTFVPSLVSDTAQVTLLTGAPTDAKTLATAGLRVNNAGISYLHLLYLNKSGVFADPRVREAVSLAIDRGAICDALLGGACTPTGQPVKDTSWAYDKNLKAPDLDLAKVRSLLTESGHPNGFAFKAVVSSAGTQLQTELTAIQQMLADASITMTITAMPVAQLLPSLATGKADAYYSVNTGGVDPSIPLAQMSAPAYDPGGYSYPPLAQALAEAKAANTPQAREPAYQKASAAYQEGAFNVVVLNQHLRFAVTSTVSGVSTRDPLVVEARGVTTS